MQQKLRKIEGDRSQRGRDRAETPPPAALGQTRTQTQRDAHRSETPADARKDEQPTGSIMDSIPEPTVRELLTFEETKHTAAEPAPTAEEVAQEKAAQEIVDACFSGDKDGQIDMPETGVRGKGVQNRVVQKFMSLFSVWWSDAMRADTNAAAGPPRTAN